MDDDRFTLAVYLNGDDSRYLYLPTEYKLSLPVPLTVCQVTLNEREREAVNHKKLAYQEDRSDRNLVLRMVCRYIYTIQRIQAPLHNITDLTLPKEKR